LIPATVLPSGAPYVPLRSKKRTGSASWVAFMEVGEGEGDHAERHRDVGEVECWPAADLDVVGDGAGPYAVREVAQCPAGQQPRGNPEPGTGRVAREDVADD